jgi:P27 family predicted phage terminase small subunit
MGRPRKPTALKILEGDQPCRIASDAPSGPKGAGPCPDDLGDVGRAAWTRVTTQLEEMGVLTLADGESIALYASTYELWAEAKLEVERDGLTVVSPMGIQKPHPLLATLKECRSQMTRLLTQFGMTPGSRSSLHVAGKPEDDPLLTFLAKPDAKKAKAKA